MRKINIRQFRGVFLWSIVMVVFLAILLGPQVLGQDPLPKSADANVRANIIPENQMVRFGSHDSSSMKYPGGYSRAISDTILPGRRLHIITLNCE